MEPEFAPARGPEAAGVWRDVLAPLAAEMTDGLPALSLRVVGEIRDAFPELFPDADAFEENRAASEQNLALMLGFIREGRDPAGAGPPPASVAYVREAVRRGVPSEAMLRSLRLGHHAFLDAMHERLGAYTDRQEDFARAVALLSAWSFATIDQLSTWAAIIYEEERERWLRSAAASQTQTIQATLAGEEVDAQAAGLRLRYPLERTHVALVAWVAGPAQEGDTFAALRTAVTEAAARAGLESLLVEPLGLLATAAWIGSPGRVRPEVLDALGFDPAAAPGVRLAAGEPAAGLGGFAASHRQALEARRVAELRKAPAGTVTRYGDVALDALATVDPEQARDFIAAQLGPLAGGDRTARRLAGTVAAYLDAGSSLVGAARRLGVHENTIRYRLRQAEERLGRPLAERTLELRVALRLAGADAVPAAGR